MRWAVAVNDWPGARTGSSCNERNQRRRMEGRHQSVWQEVQEIQVQQKKRGKGDFVLGHTSRKPQRLCHALLASTAAAQTSFHCSFLPAIRPRYSSQNIGIRVTQTAVGIPRSETSKGSSRLILSGRATTASSMSRLGGSFHCTCDSAKIGWREKRENPTEGME